MDERLSQLAQRAIKENDVGLLSSVLSQMLRAGPPIDDPGSRGAVVDALCATLTLFHHRGVAYSGKGDAPVNPTFTRPKSIEEVTGGLDVDPEGIVCWPMQSFIMYGVKSGAIAVGLDRAFGPLCWDFTVDRVEILRGPVRSESASGRAYWKCDVLALGTIRGRLAGKPDVVRQGVGAATEYRSAGSSECVTQAIDEAVKRAFKNAAKFIGRALRPKIDKEADAHTHDWEDLPPHTMRRCRLCGLERDFA